MRKTPEKTCSWRKKCLELILETVFIYQNCIVKKWILQVKWTCEIMYILNQSQQIIISDSLKLWAKPIS